MPSVSKLKKKRKLFFYFCWKSYFFCSRKTIKQEFEAAYKDEDSDVRETLWLSGASLYKNLYEACDEFGKREPAAKQTFLTELNGTKKHEHLDENVRIKKEWNFCKAVKWTIMGYLH